ncbi:MAG TPA: indole-3-glycerol-phosphate synthase TrpC, partial [Afifellaceae bacterium]|nr:indole-3-glycerol-phosphate synthase TrpC [Afifellaceae bacterium]
MSDILSQIEVYKRDEIEAARAAVPLEALRARAADAAPPRGFAAALSRRADETGAALIAEVKKASPSKG